MSAPLPKLKVRQTALLEKARAALTKNNDDAAMKYFKQVGASDECLAALRTGRNRKIEPSLNYSRHASIVSAT